MKFEIKEANTEDISLINRIIQNVWQQMPYKDWFAPDDEQILQNLLQYNNGTIWKAVVDNTNIIAGFLIVTYPGLDSENLGYDISLSKDKLSQVAHMDTIVVLPDYRGHRLQQKLTTYAESILKEKGFKYLMCTIHPNNVYSLNNMQKCGYKVILEKLKYGGLPRCILLKEIT